MTDYNDLITRLRSMDGKTPMAAADAIAELVDRVAYLESRLEVTPEHDIDGISARDATIHHQDECISELKFRLTESEDTNKALRVRLGSELHEPVTTVEDRYNADGKSCHITDYLPAGMKLYARPVHAEPVNARLLRLIKKARITIFDGLETPCELEHPASIDDRMLVTEIDSAIADAEAQQAGPVRLTEKYQDNLSIPYVGMGGVENYRAYARAIETFVLRANGFKLEVEQ